MSLWQAFGCTGTFITGFSSLANPLDLKTGGGWLKPLSNSFHERQDSNIRLTSWKHTTQPFL